MRATALATVVVADEGRLGEVVLDERRAGSVLPF
jgi:hypothetical protein